MSLSNACRVLGQTKAGSDTQEYGVKLNIKYPYGSISATGKHIDKYINKTGKCLNRLIL